MKNSWTKTFRRLAAGAIVAGATAFSSAMCYAQIAFDSAADPVYNDGWQGTVHNPNGTVLSTGDNGGFGFTAWNFDANYWWYYDGVFYPYNRGINAIDDGLQSGLQFSNQYNNIGRAWDNGIVQYVHPNGSIRASFPHVGRGLASPLQVGQTLSMTIDNPTERVYYKGFQLFLRGGTGGVNGNHCNRDCSPTGNPPSGPPYIPTNNSVERLRLQIFNFTNCAGSQCDPSDPRAQWLVAGTTDTTTPITDVDSAAGGMRIDVTLTGVDTYSVTLTPLANPGGAFTVNGTMPNPGVPIDWIQLTNFNEVASANAQPPSAATDFYISQMSVIPEPGTFGLLVLGSGSLLSLGMTRRRRKG
jgi:hypothetical protein